MENTEWLDKLKSHISCQGTGSWHAGALACILKRTSGKSVTDLSVLEQLR